MTIEAAAAALVLALALLPLLRVGRRRGSPAAAALGWGMLCLAVAWAGAHYRTPHVPEADVPNRPIEVREDGFVSARACAACHPAEYASWDASFHSGMTQRASPESVLAPFDLELRYGSTYRLQRRGDEYWVVSDDPRWREPGASSGWGARQIVMTTGSHHEQMYWFSTGERREVKLFPFAYRLGERRWVPFSAVLLTHADGYPVELGQWNVTCSRCHATHARPRAHLANGRASDFDTKVAQLGIACESCHGPGEEHVRKNRSPGRRYALHVGDDGDPTIVQPERLSHRRASDICASCHSVHTFPTSRDVAAWVQRGFAFRPGDDLAKTRYLVRPGDDPPHQATRRLLANDPDFFENRFWPDGIPSAGGREHSAMMEAPCFQRGTLSCISCHQMHKSPDDPRPFAEWADDQLAPGMRGNRACLQCHESFEADLEAHTHHAASSPGSRCYNCHMPNTTYGLMKATRSHMIDSPDAAVEIATGRPNACNLCHLDQTLAWTADRLERWYGRPRPSGLDGETTADAVNHVLRGDAGQRALIAWHMGWQPARDASGSEWLAPYLGQLLVDPYSAVRDIAYRSLRTLPDFEGVEFDYLGAEAARAAVSREVGRAWAAAAPERAARPSVLIDSRGGLADLEFQRLLAERDDRPVFRVE